MMKGRVITAGVMSLSRRESVGSSNQVDRRGAAHSCRRREGGWGPGEWAMQKFFSDVFYFFSEMRRWVLRWA